MLSLLQTKDWAALRQGFGWQAHWANDILVLERKLPFGLSFLYAPEVDFYAAELTQNLAKIKEIARSANAIFVRLDFLNKRDGVSSLKIIKILRDLHFRKSFEEIQPEFRQMLDVSRSEEDILAQMKQKGRYNIKIAQRHGVVIEPSLNIDDFYGLFKETASRDGFQVRPKQYFVKLMEILGDKAALLVARYEGKVLAAGIFTFYEEMASYLYGASGNANREMMAPYLLHWEAIKLAKARDCKIYDLLAVAPFGAADSKWQIANGNNKTAIGHAPYAISHKYAGITRFKEQFGGQKIQLIGSWDLILKPVWYQLFKIAEKMRRK